MKKASRVSIADAVAGVLDMLPVASAAEISRMTGKKLSSVSSVLKKMHKKGVLCRRRGFGPRGGNGYWLKDSGW